MRNRIVLNKKATDTVKGMVAGPGGSIDIQKIVKELPCGHRWRELKGFHALSSLTTGELPGITELLSNSVDAVIRLKAVLKAIATGRPTSGPEFDSMFQSPRHATEELFDIPDGELAKWKAHDQGWLASRVASLILELGSAKDYKKNPTIKIVDRGIGQPESRFNDTFLNATEGDKVTRPWEAGTYGLGSIVAARVCPYQLIVSKPPTSVLGSESEPWGVIIIRTKIASSAAGKRLVCSALVYGDEENERFPTLPEGTELYVDETYFVSHHAKQLSEAEIDSIVRKKADNYWQSREEVVEMRYQVLAPTKKAKKERNVVMRLRVISRRPLPHGTMRILVDTNFTESWVRQPPGSGSGVFRQIQVAVPDPFLPFLVIENRMSPGVVGIETGVLNTIPMFGRTTALVKTAGEPIRIPIDGIRIDGVNMGSVDVSIYYAGDGDFSDEIKMFAKLPRLIRAGAVIGDGDTHIFADMIGFSRFVEKFACLVSIDRLQSDPRCMSKICSAGRTSTENHAVAQLWKKIITAVRNDERMVKIRDELKAKMPKSDELAKQISRVLNGNGDGTDGQVILSSGNRVPVCVKGTDMPETDTPEYVWLNREPKFLGKRRTLEALKPVKVKIGRSFTIGVATSCRKKINFANKSCQYKLEAYTEGSGAKVRVAKNSIVITANKVRRGVKPKPVVVVVYATDNTGFKSVPGVIKVLPSKVTKQTKLLPEPTFIEITTNFGNRNLPVGKAQMVKFSSDANGSFEGFSGELRHKGIVYPVRIAYLGNGQGKAFVPSVDGTAVGDTCLLRISANNSYVSCSEELSLVEKKPDVGIEVLKRNAIANEQAVIDAPGKEKGGLRIEFQTEDKKRGIKTEGEIVEEDSELVGVINLIAPTFMASMKYINIEIGRERKLEKREELGRLKTDYIKRMSVAIRDIGDDIAMVEGDPEARTKLLKSAQRELTRVAKCHELMTHIDLEDGISYKRYIITDEQDDSNLN